MYTPHTVTIYNVTEQEDYTPIYNVTVIKGVLLDASKGSNVLKSGLENADSVRMFIPFSATALNGKTGEEQSYLPPKLYDNAVDKTRHWTLRTSGATSATACFFVKGEVIEEGSYGAIDSLYDDVYRVSSVDEKDFGTPDMQHWEVGGR